MTAAREEPALNVDLDRALERIDREVKRGSLGTERLRLAAAAGRLLTEDARAPHAVPAFATAAMDGFALSGADLSHEEERVFERVKSCADGSGVRLQAGQCSAVATGAPMPAGADTVVPRERVKADADAIVVNAGERRGSNVRLAGETYAAGAPVLRAGTVLNAYRLALLARVEYGTVAVRRVPRVAILGLGSRLVAAGEPLAAGQVPAATVTLLEAQIRAAGWESLPPVLVGDERAIANALRQAARDADIVVSSGGTSPAAAERLATVVAEVGRVHFRGVRCKPCIPMWCATLGNTPYFALPGNFRGSGVGFEVFVQRAIRVMMDAPMPAGLAWARLVAPLRRRRAVAEFVRGRIHVDDAAVAWVDLPDIEDAACPAATDAGSVLALLPEDRRDLAAGERVRLWPWT